MAENTKIFTIDASYALAYLLEDNPQTHDIFDRFGQGEIVLAAPALLWYEVGNALKTAVIRKRITEEQGNELIREFLKLTIKEQQVDFDEVYLFAVKKRVTFYDAAYLYCSSRLNSPLLTFDKTLL